MTPTTMPRIDLARQKAKQLCIDLGLDDPARYDVADLAAIQNIYITETNLKGATARLTRRGDVGIITLSQDIAEDGSKRFTVAHEIGHFHLHYGERPSFICTEQMFFDWNDYGRQEPEANAFAAEFLMPHELFGRACEGRPPSLELLSAIAKRFRASLTATCIRYADVGPFPCILFVSRVGRLKWFRASHDFPDYYAIRVGEPVSEYSCAGDYFETGREEHEFQKVRVDAWFDDLRIGRDNMINEAPFYLKTYDTVLSLVWLE